MAVWKEPRVNLEVPGLYDDTGRELWEVWPSDTDIATFTADIVPGLLDHALDAYFSPMDEMLFKFEERLQKTGDELNTEIEKRVQDYSSYTSERQIDHTFIL